jgi:hypothetical protein
MAGFWFSKQFDFRDEARKALESQTDFYVRYTKQDPNYKWRALAGFFI